MAGLFWQALDVIEKSPHIVVREALPEDMDAFWRVVGTIYNDGAAFPDDKRTSTDRRHYIATIDGEPAGGFNLYELLTARGLATMKNGAVGLVAVLPEYRGSGVGGAMMRYALEVLRREEYPVASLYGFAERYYRRFGYEVCGGKMKFTVPVASLPRVKATMPVRQVHCYDEIQPCYEAFAYARSGLSIRDARWWERVAGGAMIYACGEPIEAYMIVNYKSGFHDLLEVRELAWNSQRSYETMLSFLGDLAVNRTTVTWHEGLDSPFFYRYLPRYSQVQAVVNGPAMYRAVHVPKALESLRSTTSGEFSLKVLDSTCPENEGPWQVSYCPSGVTVTPAETADLTLDCQAFVQALLGQPSLTDQIANGFVEVINRTGAAQAEALMPPAQVMLNDFF